MKRLILLFSIFVLGTLSVSAQMSLPDKCQAFYPEVLLKARVLKETDANALMKSSDFGQNKAPRDPRFWVVFSDRSNNTTYTSPGGGTPFKELEFNEKVRIAKIQNGWALVYTEPMEGIEYPLISQYAKKQENIKGWISMKKLLLWRSAIANSSEIYYKALLCVNLDEGDKSLSAGKKYYSPNDKSNYDRIDNTMSFRFVMKREGDMVLLSTVHSMDGHSEKVLDGWYHKNSYVAWNQRSCIEPTWKKEDVEYFADEGILLKVYDKPILDSAVYPIHFHRKPEPPKRNPYLYRQDPTILRFPILDGTTAELYNCSTFGSAEGSSSQTQSIASGAGSGLMLKEEALKDLSNINIGIVIDGTKSMEAFYPAVSNAIKESISLFDDKYKVKVGVVIYRDYGDDGFVTEKRQLTDPKNQKLHDFLINGGEYGIKSALADRTLEEALYCGINTAIDQLNFNADQSNILLVIGDCGNDEGDTKFKQDDIINKLVSKNINLIGFQVSYGNDYAYSLFNSQLGEILKESLHKRYLSLINNTRVENKDTEAAKVRMVETKDGYKLKNKQYDVFIGSLNYPYQGQTMQASKLKTLIVESINYLKETVKDNKELIALNYASAVSGKGFSQIQEGFIRSKIGDEGFEAVKKAGSLMAFKGYARKQDKSGRDFFKTIVFLSDDELSTLIMRLSGVKNAAPQLLNDKYADRAPYIEAMKALAQSMIPEDLSDEQMNRMTYDEIMQKVAGLNESAAALKSYTLSQLASPEKVPYEDFVALVSNFNRKYDRLKSLKSTKYPYTYTQGGIKYYWLPVEELP